MKNVKIVYDGQEYLINTDANGYILGIAKKTKDVAVYLRLQFPNDFSGNHCPDCGEKTDGVDSGCGDDPPFSFVDHSPLADWLAREVAGEPVFRMQDLLIVLEISDIKGWLSRQQDLCCKTPGYWSAGWDVDEAMREFRAIFDEGDDGSALEDWIFEGSLATAKARISAAIKAEVSTHDPFPREWQARVNAKMRSLSGE